MKLVDYTDELGRKFRMSLPDDASEANPEFGTLIGPPILDEAFPDYPVALVVRLHNNLFEMGIFTAQDAQLRRQDVQAAWQRSLGVDTSRILEMYGKMEEVTEVQGISVPKLDYDNFAPRGGVQTPTRRRRRR